MIKDEYERLIKLIEESKEPSSLELILKQAVVFFETLRAIFPTAEKEEKAEIVQMIGTLKAKIDQVARDAAAKAGMTPEKLTEISDDPSHYTPEQWRLMQETKRKLYDSARRLSATMEEKKKKEGTAPPPKDLPREKRPMRPTTRRVARKKWTKS